MLRRHPRRALPRLWLVTDERQGDALLAAVARLPQGAGVVFRHYATAPTERRRLFDAVRRIARRRRLWLLLAGPPRLAIAWQADGVHGRRLGRHWPGMLRSAPVHSAIEIVAAMRERVDLVFLSPLHPTRSHPGAKPLGRLRFTALAGLARAPVIALGGMNGQRFRAISGAAYGWAAIDALGDGGDQKRKAVPM